jgi:hypothetical protein
VEEMKEHRKEAVGRLAKEYFDEVDKFLSSMTGKIQKKEDRTAVPRLKTLLSELRKEVERTQKTVGRLRQERRDWHFGVWQHLWPEIPRKNLVSRKIELDTRLQVELGKMLADYLRPEDQRERVSMETIARLIFLAYRVGGFTYEDASRTHVFGTRRNLTVRNIRDNLRYAGIEKAESFRGKRV